MLGAIRKVAHMKQRKRDRKAGHSHLFTVRMWPEALGDGRIEWRGRLQHVLSGETRSFRDWASLVACLVAMLPALDEGDSDA
jgi:hypothetical protein